MIHDQVRLPLSVAFGIVIQGIRIRFGRSLITISGVVLGIAFLSANLTGQQIKQAVRDEDTLRADVKRMASFLEAEMGPPRGQTVGIVQTGPLTTQEARLVQMLVDGRLQAFRWYAAPGAEPVDVPGRVQVDPVELDDVAQDAVSVLLLGSGPAPEPLKNAAGLARFFKSASAKVLAYARGNLHLPEAEGVSLVGLARRMTEDERAKIQAEKRRQRFRRNWLLIISMLVTVAGIANAMLMSVTERFREIGTMKCLGALSSFIRWVFFFESSLMGAVGGAAGSVLGIVFSIALYGFTYGYGAILASTDYATLAMYVAAGTAAGVAFSIIAAIYPASVASRMVPANALRTNV